MVNTDPSKSEYAFKRFSEIFKNEDLRKKLGEFLTEDQLDFIVNSNREEYQEQVSLYQRYKALTAPKTEPIEVVSFDFKPPKEEEVYKESEGESDQEEI